MTRGVTRMFARPIAHRGLHGCGQGGPIENSLGAARDAISAGYGIECDVRLSRDGEPMVFHDRDLSRLTGRDGDVAAFDAADLVKMSLGDSGDTIPSLAMLLELIDGKVPLVIEVKADGVDGPALVARLASALYAYRGPVVVESFDPALVSLARARLSIPVGLVGPSETSQPTDWSAAAESDFLSWSIDWLDGAAARFPDKPLSTWTVRTPVQMARAAQFAAQIVFEGFRPDAVKLDVKDLGQR